MQIKERHERILHLLEAEGMVKNAQLAALFSVTNETIRKDLEALENAEFPPPLLPVSSAAVVKIPLFCSATWFGLVTTAYAREPYGRGREEA